MNNLRKGVVNFYEMVSNVLFTNQGKILTHSDKKNLQRLNLAYELAKLKHYDQVRDSGERYFEHLRAVSIILIEEFRGFVSIDTVIISILHDSMEDTDLTHDVLINLFGQDVADGVKNLTKLKVEDTLRFHETIHCKILPKTKHIKAQEWKERRNVEYFEHISELSIRDMAIKFSDRIHNLRTLKDCSKEKIIRKIEETEKYFMSHEINVRFPQGFEKIRKEIIALKASL